MANMKSKSEDLDGWLRALELPGFTSLWAQRAADVCRMVHESLGMTIAGISAAEQVFQSESKEEDSLRRTLLLLDIIGTLTSFRPLVIIYDVATDTIQESDDVGRNSNSPPECERHFLLILDAENHALWPLFSPQDYTQRVLSNLECRCAHSFLAQRGGERSASPPQPRIDQPRFEPLIYYWPNDKDNIWGPPKPLTLPDPSP